MIKRIFAALLAFAMLFAFSGCFGRGDDEGPDSEQNSSMGEESELVLYHQSSALSPGLMALAEEYSSSTGKKFSTKMGGSDFLGEIKSKNAALYLVDSHTNLSDWHSGGFFADLMNDMGLSSIGNKVPAGIQLNGTGIGSYGVPLLLEGYGYIFDKNMLTDLFENGADSLAEDLKSCSFTEFEGFVAAVDTYISAPSAAKITVDGNEYTFRAQKTGKAQSLTGVFSLNTENTRALEHLLSTGLAAKFGSRYEVLSATEEKVGEMSTVLKAYTEVLDLHTSHIASPNGSIGRGDEFAGGDYNYSTSVDLFARGLALFYPGGTFDAADFEKSVTGFGKNLDIMPMKLPLSDEQITASGMTAEKLQSSIVIGSRYYLAVNPNADETAANEARAFIRWLYEDPAGQKAFSGAFGGVPFNFESMGETDSGISSSAQESGSAAPEARTSSEADMPLAEGENSQIPEGENSQIPESESNPSLDHGGTPSHQIENSLMRSVAEYYAAGNWIPDMAAALPAEFAEKVLKNGLSDFWGMETWTDQNRNDLVDSISKGWNELINKDQTAVG